MGPNKIAAECKVLSCFIQMSNMYVYAVHSSDL